MLEGRNIYLRALEPSDIDVLYAWENNTDLWLISNLIAPISRHHLSQFIQDASLGIFETKQLRLMIDLNHSNESIGCIDLFDFDIFHKKAGVGILISDSQNRGKGFASEALGLLINYSFQFLGLHQLYCNILSDNFESINLFEKNNFKKIGLKKDWVWTKDDWKDEFMFQLLNK